MYTDDKVIIKYNIFTGLLFVFFTISYTFYICIRNNYEKSGKNLSQFLN